MNWGALSVVVMLCSAISLSACNSNNAGAEASVAGFSTDKITIETVDKKSLKLNVELALSPDEQERGLKFRDTLKPLNGMLFPLNPPRTAQFWMQDTVIALDLIFIRTDATIASIHSDAIPLSREPVSSNEPVAAVLELAGGEAARLGITPGAKVNWRGFNQ